MIGCFKYLMLAFVFLTMGCSTYSKKECESFNWETRGFNTALKGKDRRGGLVHYKKTCEKDHSIAPDQSKFKVGYDKGLTKFCSAESGYAFGAKGKEYVGICPKNLESDFLGKYNLGSNKFLKGRVRELETEIAHLRAENNTLQAYVDELLGVNASLKQGQNLGR